MRFNLLSTLFQLYRGCQSYWWRTPEYPEKTIDLPQVTDKLLSHSLVSSTPGHERESNSQHWYRIRHVYIYICVYKDIY